MFTKISKRMRKFIKSKFKLNFTNKRTKNKYTEKYNELYDSGMFDTLEEYNVEMEEFKEDLKLEVVSFFVENKDTIKWAMNALIDMSEFVISTLGKIASFLSVGEDRTMSERMAAQASILNNYSNLNDDDIAEKLLNIEEDEE